MKTCTFNCPYIDPNKCPYAVEKSEDAASTTSMKDTLLYAVIAAAFLFYAFMWSMILHDNRGPLNANFDEWQKCRSQCAKTDGSCCLTRPNITWPQT